MLRPFPVSGSSSGQRLARPWSSAAAGLVLALAAASVVGCKKGETAGPTSPPPPTVLATAEPAPTPSASDAHQSAPGNEAKTAQEMYGACRERVENPEEDGECTSDADCTPSGCSQEMCISKATSTTGIMSTCEVRPCFSVLDSCGCHEGRCTWSLKAPPAGASGPTGLGIPLQLPQKSGGAGAGPEPAQ